MARSGDKRSEKYRIAIEEFESAGSILMDLRATEQSVQLIAALQMDANARGAFGQALMTHAVLCYCRALVSETDRRRRINVDKKAYSPVMFRKHIAIKDLRSTAMAHYHKGKGPHGDIWTDDRLATRTVEGALSSVEVYQRANFIAAAIHDLNDLLSIAIPYVENERNRREQALDSMIQASAANDQLFFSKLSSHPFDPDAFFEGTPGAQSGF